MSFITGLLSALFPPRCERIADLIPGQVALIRGHVVPRDFIDSTLTGERCVYYRYSVDEWRNTHVAGLANDGHWAMTRSDEAIVEFYLQDAHGDRIIISPQQARIRYTHDALPQIIDLGIVGQRGQELMISAGDLLEVQGQVTVVNDLYDHNKDYRSNAIRTMLCAPERHTLEIRLLAKHHT